jgi:hypothetical protein
MKTQMFFSRRVASYARGFTLAFLALALIASSNNLAAPQRRAQNRNVVIDPKSGQRVLVNELAILAIGQDIPSIVKEFGGVLTVSVPETNTYQARFPVKSLNKLERIAKKFQKRGVKTLYVVVMNPPIPGSPQ